MKVDANEASKHLEGLFDEAAQGKEVIITRGDGAAFKLVPVPEAAPHPRFGSAKGQVWMSDDFDKPLRDFESYMP